MNVITENNLLLKKFHETQNEIEKAENALRNLHRTYRRESSRFSERYENDPAFSSFRNISRKSFDVEYENDPAFPSFRNISRKNIDVERPKLKDSNESLEESEYEDEHPTIKASLQSVVISTLRNVKSRKDAISTLNANRKVRLRNHRIVGMLQSTLRKFQDDAVKRQPQDLKRRMVEQKVESAKKEEWLRIQREKDELYICKKIETKMLQLNCFKEMMRVTGLFETWKCNEEKLLNFIVTKAEPQICYLPTSHTASSFKRFEKSRIKTEKNIRKQEVAMKKELDQIRRSYQKRNCFIDEENFEFIKKDISSDMPVKKCKFPAMEESKKYKEGNPNSFDDDNDTLYLS